MTFAYLLMWGCMFVFGSSAVIALVWAIQSGEFNDIKGGAASIFDDEEPIGRPTDAFPGGRR
jgi:cbb3-type cytochrome oxidase maturation protein